MQTRRVRTAGIATMVAVFAAASIGAGQASAAPGDPSTGFSGDGVLMSPPSGADVVVQPDGKIVLLGADASGRIVVRRMRAGGGADNSFSGDGRMTVAPPVGSTYSPVAIAMSGDSLVILAQQITSGVQRATVVRVTAGGVLDTSFSDDGIAQPYPDAAELVGATDVAVDDDGRIYVSAYRNTRGHSLIMRVLPNGDLDTTFSGDGVRFVDLDSEAATVVFSLTVSSSGRLIAAVHTVTSDSTNRLVVMRLRKGGTNDTSFGNGGRATIGPSSDSFSAADVTTGPGGSIVVVGSRGPDRDGTDDSVLVARFRADGTADSTFSGDGRLEFQMGGASSAGQSVAVDDRGRVVVLVDVNEGQPIGIVRLRANGRFDSSFSGGGRVRFEFPGTPIADAVALALNPAQSRVIVLSAVKSDVFGSGLAAFDLT